MIFDNSQDCIDFDVKYNHDILQFFVDQCDQTSCNSFTDGNVVGDTVEKLLNELETALSLSNSITQDLCNLGFAQRHNRLDYLDQDFLNDQHAVWVNSQKIQIDIDKLRFSDNAKASKLGWRLHDQYPDDIRSVSLAEAMAKLGYIYPYEELNLSVHRLESFFSHKIEYKSDQKWKVFDNPFQQTMVSNNDVVNFGFGYTYVGRQYYNKWQNFDTALRYPDHYNYETLEFAFQINLARPQTIGYSPEFLEWCSRRQVRPISTQIPIANAVDLDKNLKYYRTILYTNSRQGNRSKIILH